MRKGTFSVQKAGSNSQAHNSRKSAPKYLIGLAPGTQNYYELIQNDEDFILEAQQIYKSKIGQSMQKKQIPNLVQETVLTLKISQDENDVKKLFKKLKNKYGGHELLEVSIHRDEGHFLKDDIAYYPIKNILKKDEDWFIKSDIESDEFDIKVDINDFEKVYNFHAHAKFSMFDKELGKTARMQKKDMSSRIKFVSDELGLVFNPDKKTSRIAKPVHQVKDEHFAKAKNQQKTLAKIKDVDAQYKNERNALKASGTAIQSDYKELKKRYDKLKELAKERELTIERLKKELIVERERILELSTKLDKTKSSSELIDEAKSFVNNANIPEVERSEIKNGKSLFRWIKNKFNEFKKLIIELTKEVDEIQMEKLELEVELDKANQKIEKLIQASGAAGVRNRHRKEN